MNKLKSIILGGCIVAIFAACSANNSNTNTMTILTADEVSRAQAINGTSARVSF